MLRIVTGRSGSGKSEYLIKLMRGTEDAIYIVPEQYSFTAEKNITRAFGVSGLGNPSVLSFRRLSYYAEDAFGKERGDLITPEGRVMLMSNIVKKKADSLTLFGGAARRGDMAKTAAGLVTTFKEYAVTGEKLTNAIEKTENPLLKKKLSDCKIITDAYAEALSGSYRDSEDALELLRGAVAERGYLAGREIFIDSFTSFTPLEYSVISAMLKRAANVTIALVTGEGDEFITNARTEIKLKKIAADAGVRVSQIALGGAMYTSTEEMKALEKSFFENVKFNAPTRRVRLYAAENEDDEALFAAREAERLCRDEGLRLRDIVIMARDISIYEKPLQKAFRRFGIPLFSDRKTSLAKEPAALFLLSAIRIVSGGWREESVFSYMKTVFSPITPDEADRLENYALAAGIRRGDWRNAGEWDVKPTMDEGAACWEEIEEINEIAKRLTSPIKKLEEKIRGRKTGNEAAKAFCEFLIECALDEKTDALADSLEKEGENTAALRMRQVYDKITEIIEDFETVFRDTRLNAIECCDILSAGLESVEIGVIPSETDAVCAGSIDRARSHGAKAALILGAAEGKFPLTPKDTGIFSDFDRRSLAELGIELPPDTKGQSDMEKGLVYSALTCARDEIYISYPIASGDEKCAPSEIMRRAADVFPACQRVGKTEIERVGSARGTYEEFVSKFSEAAKGRGGAIWRQALEYYEKSPEWQDKIKALYACTNYENKTAIIKEELIKLRYGGDITTSVSRLEQYSRCPFAYFLNVTLGLKERKKLEVTAADSGNFLHEFVDEFGKGLDEDGRSWRDVDESYIDKRTQELVPLILGGVNRHLLETSPKVRHIYQNLKRIAKKSVTIISEHMKKGKFEPLGYEIVFDEKGAFKPLTIALPNGRTIRLRGRVDRADILETDRGSFVRIIDYKSGNKSFSLPDIYYGLDLQLAVYLTALCENGGYKPAGMLYFKLDDPVIEADEVTPDSEIAKKYAKTLKMTGLILKDDEIVEAMDTSFPASGDSDVVTVKRNKDGSYSSTSQVAEADEFKALSIHVKKTVKKLCREILSGKTDISPVRDACTYCAMSAVCGFDASLKGCSYRRTEKINDRDALLSMIEEAKTEPN